MTAPKGRCAGCGLEGQPRLVERHSAECGPYLELFRGQPEAALSPVAEWVRFHGAEASAQREQVREGEREERREAHRALNALRAEAAASRWVRGSHSAPVRCEPPQGAVVRCAQSAALVGVVAEVLG